MIKEVIVVEGQNDTLRLKSFFECETIETHGLGLKEETIKLIQEVNKKRGVILFLDPDTPGEKIRKRINDEIPNLKNAFVMKEDAKTNKKVGIEHASKKTLEEALKNCVTYKDNTNSLSFAEFIELGLSGKDNAYKNREILSKKYHLGLCNAKTMYKRLNMLGLTYNDIKEVLKR